MSSKGVATMPLDKTPKSPIPITVITGFLGAGKTTLLLHLLPQLPPPPHSRLCLLKNEFGSVAVDSLLTSQTQTSNAASNFGTKKPAIAGVQELLNGCICCNLVGQLSDALESLRDQFDPTRIVIETSGSAFPATLAMEINRLSKETNGLYLLDGVISVIDVENWTGYEDTSYTAKLQAKFTDLIILSKWETASERRVEDIIDKIRDLNEEVPVIKSDKGFVSKDIIFGVEGTAKLSTILDLGIENKHCHEKRIPGHLDVSCNGHGHFSEVDVLSVSLVSVEADAKGLASYPHLHTLLKNAPKDEVYRIKAVFRTSTVPQLSPMQLSLESSPTNTYILNWAFGRWTITPLAELALVNGEEKVDGNKTEDGGNWVLKMTIVLARGEARIWKKKIENGLFIKFEGEENEPCEKLKVEILT